MNITKQVLSKDKRFAEVLHMCNIYCAENLVISIKQQDYVSAGKWFNELSRSIRDLNELIDRKLDYDAELDKCFEKMGGF